MTTFFKKINQLDAAVALSGDDLLELSQDVTGTQTSTQSTIGDLSTYLATDLAPNLTFTQLGTGALTRAMQNKVREIVSITDFGAVGDGVTDNTTAIQAAIDYAETLVEAITASYDIITAQVFIPPGEYTHGELLVAQAVDGVQLVGAGEGVSVLHYAGSGIGITVGTEVSLPTFSHVWVRDLTLRGGNPAYTNNNAHIVAGSVGIQFNRVIRGSGMERCQVFGFETGADLRDCWTFKFRDCHFHDAGNSHITWQTANSGEITGCRFDDSGSTSVIIDGQGTSNDVRSLKLSGCVFQESSVGALRFIDTTSVQIDSCYFENNNQSDAGTHYEIEFVQGTSARTDGTYTLIGNYYSPGAATWTGSEGCVFVESARHVQCIGEKTGSSAYNRYLRAESEVQHVEILGGIHTNMPGDPVSRESTNTTLREVWTIIDSAGAVTERVNRHTIADREIDIGRFWNGGVTTSTGSVTTSTGNVFYNVAGNNQSITLQTADFKKGVSVFVWKYSTSGTLSVVTEGSEQISLNGSTNNQVQLAAQRGAAWFVCDGTNWVCMPGDAGATWALAA